MAFRRRRRDEDADPVEAEDATSAQEDEVEEGDGETSAAEPGRPSGPYDVDDLDAPGEGRLDLGSVWVPLHDGLELRVEVDEPSGQLLAVTLLLGGSALQIAPFAAPRTSGLWDEVRTELRGSVASQGGVADEVEGPFGTELRARMPVRQPDGRSGEQRVRFLGVDGPRWFLRGVLSGTAAENPSAAAEAEELFRQVVVVRGGTPMAPRELIPLRLPAEAEGADPAAEHAGGHDPLNPFRRGPEITEIR
jgi:Protein of unknown function (DUF3710)